MELLKRFGTYIWDFVESITFALAVFVVAYLFLFQPSSVLGTSSYPTIKPGEKFITEKVSYHFHSPQRGDFVILKSPHNQDVDFIKRIVGLPGEKLKISNGKVYINDEVFQEAYLENETYTGPESYLAENQEIVIPQNQYFVMGDNRSHSSDSRDFGPVPADSIIGHVVLRYWPIEKFGIITD